MSPDAAKKSRARQEFGRIKNIVFTVRFVFLSSAILGFFTIALWHTAIADLVKVIYGDYYGVMTAVVYLQFVVMIVGTLFVLRKPFAWTLVGACNWTLNTGLVWHFLLLCMAANVYIRERGYEEPIELGMLSVFIGFWTLMMLAFWFAVAQAARVQRILAENPELSLKRERFDPEKRAVGGVAELAYERRRETQGAEWLGLVKIGGIAVGALMVLGLVMWFLSLPPHVDPAVEKFAARWRDGEVQTIARQMSRSSFVEDLQRRGWDQQLPELGDPRIEEEGERARAEFTVTGGKVEVRFELREKAWQLDSVRLPEVVAPPIDVAIRAFREAWKKPGMAALVEQFRPSRRERFGGTMKSMFGKRGWTDERPELGDHDEGRPRPGKATVLFAIGFDEMKVRFEFWHPQWYVTGLIPPR